MAEAFVEIVMMLDATWLKWHAEEQRKEQERRTSAMKRPSAARRGRG